MIQHLIDVLIPLAMLALVALVVHLWLRTLRRQGLVAAVRFLLSWRVLTPVLGVVVLLLLRASLVFIDPQEVGVVVSLREPGGLRGQRLDPGLHVIIPLVDRVYQYPIVARTYTMSNQPLEGENPGDDSIAARTADGQLVNIDISVIYRVNPEQVVFLHKYWQNRYVDELLRPALRAIVRKEASQYTVDQINSQRRLDFASSLDLQTKAVTDSTGLLVEQVLLRNISFSPEYALSVEQKMVALQGVTQTDYEAQQMANLARGRSERIRITAQAEADARRIRARAIADARVIEAEAAAEALRRIGRSLDNRQDLLTYRYIDRLAPSIKALLVPNDSPLVLPLPAVPNAVPAAAPSPPKEDRPGLQAVADGQTPPVPKPPLGPVLDRGVR
ncbi:MAG: prohibitin family protein [Candidatus Competibacterales bacterium]